MSFLPSNQQRQSTEGIKALKVYVKNGANADTQTKPPPITLKI